ncbi:tRNA glutamyl-Q(34) synthetase GluQRS [Arthrobacter sp. zg-Y40]|uniref:tRNA glutamyl-Q(34) synthetase GluQRS n=1 Tax=unclassified Arthrobacter TaxID=235627 RepID=UPI001D144A5B|nr:tRNA glutamyl-Q(34) synthetase GluQRS [Arthrobacter sp. zg-Y1143]MCC3279863.1 tRNA glutamyl-Q(34) synthetase GluQRS [Arthrobacter sp. zg-Y40]MDK1328230.1 tRNA glutamyl-Q(34) synthetase GluQRS [Arthrobacter sp. zg-Y1143]
MPTSDAAGRFAPSPTGELHVGNLRTALLAWLFARSTGRRFLLRMEDLDRVRSGAEAAQLRDLAAVGLDWDGDIIRQSERLELYLEAIAELRAAGLVYECFCTRREVAEAASAPHAPPGAYPGTCRNLTEEQRAVRRRERPAALRLRAQVPEFTVTDELHGSYTSAVDDLVLLRNDGVPSYNLAVVLDDALQGIDQVVRGDDLLSSAPRQAYLGSLLGLPPVRYAHVPLALNTAGQRLAKRDGAVTLPDLAAAGMNADAARELILASLGLPGNLQAALAEFNPASLPREPWIFTAGPNAGPTARLNP